MWFDRGRVFGLSVSLSVCPPFFGLFARLSNSQGLIIDSTGRSGEKSGSRLTETAQTLLLQCHCHRVWSVHVNGV